MNDITITYPVNKVEIVNNTKYSNAWMMKFQHMYPSYDKKQFVAQLLEGPLVAYAMVYELSDEGFTYHVILIKVSYNNGVLKIVVNDVDDNKLVEINGKWGDHPGCCDAHLLHFVEEIVDGLTNPQDQDS